MKKNILLVVNPISGDVDKSELIDATTLFAIKENLNLFVYTTSGDDDISKIKALYEKHKPQRIIIAGGDGTIKMVAEATEDQDVILGILPAGSSNGLAVWKFKPQCRKPCRSYFARAQPIYTWRSRS